MAIPARRSALLLVFALAALAVAVTEVDRVARGPQSEPRRTRISAGAGIQTYPAFSPDGRRIAYCGRPEAEDSPFHIFIRAASGGGPARALTAGEGSDIGPAWSPDGTQIAFLRLADGRAQYFVIPAAGGGERAIASFPNSRGDAQPLPATAWTRDGHSLLVVDTGASPPALVSVPLAGGAAVPVTHPPEDSQGDSTPAVSPDGETLAFVRGGASGADIYLCDLHGGALRRLTFDDTAIRGLAWSGGDLIYAATRAGRGSQLFRVSADGGSAHLIAAAGNHANFPAAAGASSRLVYADSPEPVAIWRARLHDNGEAGDARALLRSTGRDTWPDYSPDGKRIVFISDRTGSDEIWESDGEGARPVQVTRFPDWPRLSQPRWSPDQRTLLFGYAGTLGRGLFTFRAGDAQPKMVASGGADGSWSRDGKWIYFDSEGRVWRAPAGGGKREAVTADFGTSEAEESPDGRYLYFRHRRQVFRMDAAGGGERGVFTPEYAFWNRLAPFDGGLYYLGLEFGGRRAVVAYYDFASGQSSVILPLHGREAGTALSFAISPDRQYLLYPQVDRNETNLMEIENFR